MKKLFAALLVISLLIIPMSISASAVGTVNAYEKAILESLSEEIGINGSTFRIPDEYINQAENYFKTVDLSEKEAQIILDEIADSKRIAAKNNISSMADISKLPPEEKQKILKNGKDAAAAVDANFKSDGDKITVTDKNTVIFEDTPVVKVTGAQTDFTAIILSVSGVIAILAAATVVAHKKNLFVK